MENLLFLGVPILKHIRVSLLSCFSVPFSLDNFVSFLLNTNRAYDYFFKDLDIEKIQPTLLKCRF